MKAIWLSTIFAEVEQLVFSAKYLKRQFIGIDISQDAVELTNSRLEEMIISESNLF